MSNRDQLIRDLKDYSIVNHNNLTMIAAEEIEAMAAELYSKRTGQVLLDLEKEREISDIMASHLQMILNEEIWDDEPVLDVLQQWNNLRAGKA
jgi:hypothetical protein